MKHTICLNCHEPLAFEVESEPGADGPFCKHSCLKQWAKLSHEDQAIRKCETIRYERFLQKQQPLEFH